MDPVARLTKSLPPSRNLICAIICRKYGHIYIGETKTEFLMMSYPFTTIYLIDLLLPTSANRIRVCSFFLSGRNSKNEGGEICHVDAHLMHCNTTDCIFYVLSWLFCVAYIYDPCHQSTTLSSARASWSKAKANIFHHLRLHFGFRVGGKGSSVGDGSSALWGFCRVGIRVCSVFLPGRNF